MNESELKYKQVMIIVVGNVINNSGKKFLERITNNL